MLQKQYLYRNLNDEIINNLSNFYFLLLHPRFIEFCISCQDLVAIRFPFLKESSLSRFITECYKSLDCITVRPVDAKVSRLVFLLFRCIDCSTCESEKSTAKF